MGDFTVFCLGLLAGGVITAGIIGLINNGMRKER